MTVRAFRGLNFSIIRSRLQPRWVPQLPARPWSGVCRAELMQQSCGDVLWPAAKSERTSPNYTVIMSPVFFPRDCQRVQQNLTCNSICKTAGRAKPRRRRLILRYGVLHSDQSCSYVSRPPEGAYGFPSGARTVGLYSNTFQPSPHRHQLFRTVIAVQSSRRIQPRNLEVP